MYPFIQLKIELSNIFNNLWAVNLFWLRDRESPFLKRVWSDRGNSSSMSWLSSTYNCRSFLSNSYKFGLDTHFWVSNKKLPDVCIVYTILPNWQCGFIVELAQKWAGWKSNLQLNSVKKDGVGNLPNFRNIKGCMNYIHPFICEMGYFQDRSFHHSEHCSYWLRVRWFNVSFFNHVKINGVKFRELKIELSNLFNNLQKERGEIKSPPPFLSNPREAL